jgi:hypothetical protein
MTPREKKLVEAVRFALDGVMPLKSRKKLKEALAAYAPKEPPYDEYDIDGGR